MFPAPDKKKKGVAALMISIGKKSPLGEPKDSGDSEGKDDESDPGESSEEGLDKEQVLKDDLDAAMQSKDASAMYDAIRAISMHCMNEE